MAGNDAHTKLLIHSDTTDGSTTFIDSAVGGAGHTITPVADVHHETDAQKFGATSIYHDGALDKLTIPAHADFDFSVSDFTIDCWFRTTINGTSQGIFSSDVYGFYLFWDAGYKKLNFGLSSNGSSYDIYEGVANSIKNSWISDQWYHIALVWDGTNYKVYIDGVLDIAVVSSTGLYGTIGIQIGFAPIFSTYLTGYIDEFRVSKGIARWTANFTPPTEAYTKVSYDITAEPLELTATLSANLSILIGTQPFEITSSLSISDIYRGVFVAAEPLQLTSSLGANLSMEVVATPFELTAELSANIPNQIVASALQLIGNLDANVSLGHFVVAEPLSLEAVLSANLSTQIVAQALELVSELSARPIIILRDDMKYYLDIESVPIVTDALRLLQRILTTTEGKTISDFVFDRTHGINQ